MEILFKNVYQKDENWVKETHKFFMFHKAYMIIFHLFFLFMFVTGFIYLVIFKEPDVLLFIFPFFWVTALALRYKRTVNSMPKQLREVYGDVPEIVTEVDSEGFTVYRPDGSQSRLDFENVKNVCQSDNYIYIISANKVMYTFGKKGFTAGVEEDFFGFVKAKLRPNKMKKF